MKIQYIVKGNVRGLISKHRKLSAAIRSFLKDKKECSKLGGGSYSDVNISVLIDAFEYDLPIIFEPYYDSWKMDTKWYFGSWDMISNKPSIELQKVIENNK